MRKFIYAYFILFFSFVYFFPSMLFAQTDSFDLKFRGSGTQGTIAMIVSNQSVAYSEVNDLVRDLVADDFRIAVVPKDYTYDLTKINSNTNPFVKEVQYVLKLSILNQSARESLINAHVEILRLSDNKLITKDLAGPRSNMKILSSAIRKMFEGLIPRMSVDNPVIREVNGSNFIFEKKSMPDLRRGDEIVIRYQNAREGITESYAIVSQFSNDMVIAKDLSQKVQKDDKVLRVTPKRNRFSLNLGLIVPTAGERTLLAQEGNNLWKSSTFWPAGFKIEGEYERFFPYRLTSTTAFGIYMDRALSTYIMTGIGYRVIKSSWEFIPYFRLGFAYTPVSLQTVGGNKGDLKGFTLRFGFNVGLNMITRITPSIYIGIDLGIQYFPADLVSVLSDSEKVKPQWQEGREFGEGFPMTTLYPYLSLKVGWLF